MTNYRFGSIQVEVEVEEDRDQVVSLQHIKEQYGFLRRKMKEHLYVVYLNNDNQVIGDKLVSVGESMQTSLDVKDIVRTAILTDAEAVILVHNHASTSAQPSTSDLKATEQVQTCLERFGIQLLDHVILSRKECYSFKLENQLEVDKDVEN